MRTMIRNWRTWIVAAVFILAICGMSFAAIADHYERRDVFIISMCFGLSFFMGLPIVWVSTKEPVLFVGVVPSAVAWFSISIPKVLAEVEQDRMLIVFMLYLVWAFLLIVWAAIAWVLLQLDRRCRERMIWGPVTELCTAIGLMAPWILAAFVLPATVSAKHQVFTIVASIGIGLLWSKVLSEPFARLVRVLREQSAP